MPRGTRAPAVAAALLAVLSAAPDARARSGTHPPAVSTWDTRASSVALVARTSFMGAGRLHAYGYSANFTATTGNLSSQFGAYYLRFQEDDDAPTVHGLGGAATALFSLPLASRYDHGIPKLAVAFYAGAAPAVLVGGRENFLTVPLALGLGLPLSPLRTLTLTPWIEAAPAFNLDNAIRPVNALELAGEVEDLIDVDNRRLNLTEEQARQILAAGVVLERSFGLPMRAGLDLTLHFRERAAVSLGAGIGALGNGFGGGLYAQVGAGFILRWDRVVPAVLPAERRLRDEACEAVEARLRSCPAARRAPECERERPYPE